MVAPTGWKEVRLGELVSRPITDGPHLTPRFYNDGVPFLSVNNIVDGKILWNELRYISKEDDKVFAVKCKPRRGDILFGKAASVGKIALVDTDLDFNVWSPLAVIRCSTLSRPQFVYFALQTSWTTRQIALLTNSSSQGNIGMTDIAQIKISLPPLKEQEAIAEALSDADSAIESLDALIAKKRDVKQATMQQLLTGRTRLPDFNADWIEVRLGDLGSTFGGLTGKSSKDFGEGNSSFVTFMNVMSNVVLDNQGTEKVRIGNGERQSQLLEGDVIFNGSSETPEEVGFGSAVRIELSGLYLNSFCFGFRRKDKKSFNPKFFAYLTRSPLGRDIIRPMAQGSTRYNIAKTNLLNGRFPLPPLKEQEAIAEALTVMDDELAALTEQVSKLRMVKEGMMQDLLTGKVRLV